jgi:hypothetical protein
MPQSITTAPCFIQSPFTILGCPTPTTSISAPATYIDFHQIHHTQLFKLLKKNNYWLTTSGRFLVFE